MRYVQIKVCGITRPQDARLAAALGADMIGMIFYPGSKRAISLATAEKVVQALPPIVDRVGVFVNQRPEKILRFVARLGLQWIQLHGDETDVDIKKLQRAGYRVIKAFSVRPDLSWRSVRSSPADMTMLDSGNGGSGIPFDWKAIPQSGIRNLVLAGGLNVHNVVQGIRLARPAVIDVNSGVESKAGIKSAAKLKQFFDVVNSERAK